MDVIENSSIILRAYTESIFLSEAYLCNRTRSFFHLFPSCLIQRMDSARHWLTYSACGANILTTDGITAVWSELHFMPTYE